MTLTIPRAALSSLVDSVLPALSQGHALIRIETFPERVVVTADDTEMRVEAMACLSGCEASAPVFVDGKHLASILKALPDGDLELCAVGPKRLQIVGGRAVYTLLTSADDDAISNPAAMEGVGGFSLPTKSLIRLINVAVPALADDDRYNLRGVHVECCDNTIRFVATDGGRLNLAVEPYTSLSFTFPRILIPERILNVVRKMATKTFPEEELVVDVSWSDRAIRFDNGNLAAICRCNDADFPAYRSVIPSGYLRRILVDREAFLIACKRVALEASDKARTVKVEVEPDKVVLSASAFDQGEANHPVPIALDGEPITVGVNITFVIDALSAIATKDVSVEMGEALSPILIRPEPVNGDLLIVMPIRLS